MARTLILCRHGQTRSNIERRFQGRLETELSEAGVRQAEALRDTLAQRPLAAIYSSPQRRCLQTAAIVARGQHGARDEHPDSQVVVRRELADIDHGEWSGLLYSEVMLRWPDMWGLWREHPTEVRFPGGESLLEVRARALSFLAWMRHEHAQGQLLVITHGEVLQLLLGYFLELEPDHFRRVPAHNCAVSVIEDHEIPFVMGINDTCHLQGLRSTGDV